MLRRTFCAHYSYPLILCIILLSCGRANFSAVLDDPSSPAFSVPAGDYTEPLAVSLSAESGLPIRYTTDSAAGLADRTAWTLYAGTPVPVDRSLRLRSYAYRDEANLSEVTSADYRIFAAAPVFAPAPGNYVNPVSVTMTSPTAGASIRWTLDGTDPTETNGTEAANGGSVLVSVDSVLKARAFLSPREPSAVTQGSYFFMGAFEIGITISLPSSVTYVFSGAASDLTHGTDMTVTATHSLASPSYQWYLNGTAIPGETAASVTLGNSGPLGTLDYGAYTLTLEIFSGGYPYTEDVGFNVVP